VKQQYADSIAAVIRPLAPGARLVDADVTLIDQLAAQWDARRPKTPPPSTPSPTLVTEPIDTIRLTPRTAAELVGHEAIVLEWYLDSENVGTWGIGVTNRSGHSVDRYKDKPQTVGHCLEIYIWLLNNNYIPDVRKAFAGCKLTEAQFADFLETHYLNSGDLTERRAKEAELFFDGVWSGDGTALVVPVAKPSYKPSFRKAERIEVAGMLQGRLASPATNPR